MPRTTTVEVNGYAGRHIRKLLNLEAEWVAGKMGVTTNYLYRIEIGYRVRLSITKFEAWQDALLVEDRRALMSNPNTQRINGSDKAAAA